VDLHPGHAEVRLAGVGALGPHERQRQEGAAVAVPRRERRQPVQARLLGHLADWAVGDVLRADPQCLGGESAQPPQLSERRRDDRLRRVDDALDELLRPRAERQVHALGGAEEVRDDGERGASRPAEEQRRPAARHDAAVDLGDLEPRVDRDRHLGEVAAGAEQVEERAEVADGLHAASVGAASGVAPVAMHPALGR
jgi:hypothetical protein